MYAIVMKKEYIEKILSGKTNFDARLYDTKIRGRVAFMEAGTNMVYGYANLVNTYKISYKNYVMWHVSSTYTEEEAIAHLKQDVKHIAAYSYEFSDVEVLKHPLVIYPHKINKAFVSYNEEQNVRPYEKISLF